MAYEDDYQMMRVPVDVWALIKETGRMDRREVGNQLTFLVEEGVRAVGYNLNEVDLARPIEELTLKRYARDERTKAVPR